MIKLTSISKEVWPSKRFHLDHDMNKLIRNCVSCDKNDGFNGCLDRIEQLGVEVDIPELAYVLQYEMSGEHCDTVDPSYYMLANRIQANLGRILKIGKME